MQSEIIKYLSKYVQVPNNLEDILNECAFIRQFSKNTLLLKGEQVSNECYFIFKGCIRCYFFEDGDEITTGFYTETQSVTPPNYGKNTPSKLYFECLEDTIASVGTSVGRSLQLRPSNKQSVYNTVSAISAAFCAFK